MENEFNNFTNPENDNNFESNINTQENFTPPPINAVNNDNLESTKQIPPPVEHIALNIENNPKTAEV